MATPSITTTTAANTHTNNDTPINLLQLPSTSESTDIIYDNDTIPSSSSAFASNPHLNQLHTDVYYHLGVDTSIPDLINKFHNIQYVLLCGTSVRAYQIAQSTVQSFQHYTAQDYTIESIGKNERYTIYKVGCVLVSSHGMGEPSFSILLHEITKLLNHCYTDTHIPTLNHDNENHNNTSSSHHHPHRRSKPIYIRIGTCGGLGVDSGTVIVSNGTVNGLLQPYYEYHILGKIVRRPSVIDQSLVEDIIDANTYLSSTGSTSHHINIIQGKTLTTACFYEGQARVDGAICQYNEADELTFLQHAYDHGVRNIEMEANMAASFTHKLQIPFACICISLWNRLHHSNQLQATATKEQLMQYQHDVIGIALNFVIHDYMKRNNHTAGANKGVQPSSQSRSHSQSLAPSQPETIATPVSNDNNFCN